MPGSYGGERGALGEDARPCSPRDEESGEDKDKDKDKDGDGDGDGPDKAGAEEEDKGRARGGGARRVARGKRPPRLSWRTTWSPR